MDFAVVVWVARSAVAAVAVFVHFARAALVADSAHSVAVVLSVLRWAEPDRYRDYLFGTLLPYSFRSPLHFTI